MRQIDGRYDKDQGVDGITWEKNGEPNKAPKGVKIENGVYVSMD